MGRRAAKQDTPDFAFQVGWAPQPGSQEAFLACSAFEVLLHGNRGGGKTDALLMDFAQFVGKGYGADWSGILFRRSFPELQDVIQKSRKWFSLIFPGAKYNKVENKWTFPSGEMLRFAQMKTKDDYEKYHGGAWPWIGWEELTNWPDLVMYLRMMSCCRSSNKAVPLRFRATTNPSGVGHNAVKMRFRLHVWDRINIIDDSVNDEGHGEEIRVTIPSRLAENTALLSANPNYRAKVLAAAASEHERKAWDLGTWDIVSGGMFDDMWRPDVHVLRPFDIPPSWPIYRSFDWGQSKPFSVGWWTVSPGDDLRMADGRLHATVRGDMIRVAEWYGWTPGKPNVGVNQGRGMLATEIAEGIVDRESALFPRHAVTPGPADSSIFDAENGNCIATDMGRMVRSSRGLVPGPVFVRADKSPGSRRTGWQQIRQSLKNAVTENGMPRENPGLFVFDRCEQFIRTVPALPRSEKNPDDVDTDAEDHIGDETRYFVRSTGSIVGFGRSRGHY
jgi:hypothetical protein